MRESNFAFPATNRAAVCITSHLYDRRALDTTSPLPLFNTLTHLTTLSSTSPRIREILVMDGGLERLVRILRDFCSNPPPPEPPTQFYGLLPPNHTTHSRQPQSGPPNHDPKRPFDRAAAYRFSLALQCLVNIGVRGSELIRARVVQAGALDVVGCILEAWLISKGISIAPSCSLTGMPRESKEARLARKAAIQENIRVQEEQAIRASLNNNVFARASTIRIEEDESHSAGTSNNGSPSGTPLRSTSPTDNISPLLRIRRQSAPTNAVASTSNVRADAETESDADVEMEDATQVQVTIQPQPEQTPAQVDILEPDMNMNIDMILSGVGDRNVMEINMDMGRMGELAGGMDVRDLGITTEGRERREPAAEDLTPRATFATLPDIRAPPVVQRQPASPAPTLRPLGQLLRAPNAPPTNAPRVPQPGGAISATLPHGPRPPPPPHDAGPYREEDVLLSLQLLAYLSKYPHVRQAFYKPRAVFNPALQQTMQPTNPPPDPFKTLSRGKEKRPSTSSDATPSSSSSSTSSTSTRQPTPPGNYPLPSRAGPALTQSTNVFSLVERFTFRASPAELNLPNVPPPIPPEIQHWAGVVMRNACRKDESRGGIRQCANVQCGKWETFPREFAKCRRCRKAKYCGKECQSKAWSEGHRFWCSAKEEEGEGGVEGAQNGQQATAQATAAAATGAAGPVTGTGTPSESAVPTPDETPNPAPNLNPNPNVNWNAPFVPRGERPRPVLHAVMAPTRFHPGTGGGGGGPNPRTVDVVRAPPTFQLAPGTTVIPQGLPRGAPVTIAQPAPQGMFLPPHSGVTIRRPQPQVQPQAGAANAGPSTSSIRAIVRDVREPESEPTPMAAPPTVGSLRFNNIRAVQPPAQVHAPYLHMRRTLSGTGPGTPSVGGSGNGVTVTTGNMAFEGGAMGMGGGLGMQPSVSTLDLPEQERRMGSGAGGGVVEASATGAPTPPLATNINSWLRASLFSPSPSPGPSGSGASSAGPPASASPEGAGE